MTKHDVYKDETPDPTKKNNKLWKTKW